MNAATRARLTPLQAWWSGLALRERRMLALGGAVLVLYALLALAVLPAWRTLARAPAQQAAVEEQLQAMQRLAAEAQELRAMPPVNPEQSATALKAASERLGEQAKLSLQGDRAVLTLTGVGTEALKNWLAEVRSGARARPVEATLSRGAGGYSGTIVVAFGGGA